MKNLDSINSRLYSLRHSNLFRLSEKYPDISRILVTYKANSGSWDGHETSGKIDVDGEMLFDFLVECPNGTCTGIGIDLNSEVDGAAHKKLHHVSGEKECDGWEDMERYGSHRCGSTVRYEITIDYRKSNP